MPRGEHLLGQTGRNAGHAARLKALYGGAAAQHEAAQLLSVAHDMSSNTLELARASSERASTSGISFRSSSRPRPKSVEVQLIQGLHAVRPALMTYTVGVLHTSQRVLTSGSNAIFDDESVHSSSEVALLSSGEWHTTAEALFGWHPGFTNRVQEYSSVPSDCYALLSLVDGHVRGVLDWTLSRRGGDVGIVHVQPAFRHLALGAAMLQRLAQWRDAQTLQRRLTCSVGNCRSLEMAVMLLAQGWQPTPTGARELAQKLAAMPADRDLREVAMEWRPDDYQFSLEPAQM